MKITPTSLTMSQLLGSENEQYVVPAYQRRYSWKRQQVQDLWDDLRILEGIDSHLLGTIVCLAGHHQAGVNRLELVDGQQRLTTMSVLLHCLLDRLKSEQQDDESKDLARLLIAKALGKDAQPKIVLDTLDAKQFKRHVAGDMDEPVDNERLLHAFQLLRARVAALSLEDTLTLLYHVRNQALIIRLDVSEAKDAFKLFETINNRGLQLSATDIIKNFILGNAARFGPDLLDFAREQWAELLVALDGLPVDTFFRQYITSRRRTRITRSEVVHEFQRRFMQEVKEAESLPEREYFADEPSEEDDDEVEGDDPTDEEEDAAKQKSVTVKQVSFKAFVKELVRSSEVYAQIFDAKTKIKRLDRRLRNLRLIRAQQSYGFLMSLRVAGCTDEHFEKVLELTEIFLLRRHVTQARANENETLFAQLCAVDPKNPLPKVRELYREQCPSDEKFRQEFATAVFPPALLDRARYCLEQFEIDEQGGRLELVPGGPDTVHVEHIIPQKIKTKRAKKQFGDWVSYLGKDALSQHPRYVGRIGNLTLFAGELNISASNNPYLKKKKAHAQSAFKLTQALPRTYPEFRFKQIDKRSQALAEKAVRIWPLI